MFASATTSNAFAIDRALLAKLDPGANAIVAIDVENLIKTKLAVKQEWAARDFARNPGREISLPPDAKELLISSRLDTANNMNVVWQIALLSSNVSIPIQKIAQAESGYIDWIGSSQVVWAPSELYFAALNRTTLGVVYPADRQMTARWLKESRNSSPPNDF